GKIIRKEYDARRTARNSLHIVAETRVAVHAVPVVLKRLAEKLPTQVRAVEKSIRRYKKRELRIKKYELRRGKKREIEKDSEKVNPLKTERVEPLRWGKEWKGRKRRTKINREMHAGNLRYAAGVRVGRKEQGRQAKRGRENGIKKVAAASKMIPSASESGIPFVFAKENRQRLRRLMRRAQPILEVKNVSKKEKRLWVAIAVAVGEFVQKEKKPELKRSKLRVEEVTRKPERITIAGVRVGWMLWMLLFGEHGPKNFPLSKKQGETLNTKNIAKDSEAAPWILLSIIYYLTAIREQGMRHYPVIQVTKRKRLPKYGIIFVLAS
ncbi:hypothetical protein HY032_02945, partial [Candidatus Gottesmanbacteria bacterium]|nr:hypothetical protein [Candidatus Gottesmanbacteria bacterium]